MDLLEILKKGIVSGELKIGERLPAERALAAQYNLSRGAVRKVIQKLIWDGLLESRRGDGTYVTSSQVGEVAQGVARSLQKQQEELREVFEFRKVIEPGIAELAAMRRSDTDLQRLRSLLFEQQNAVLKGRYSSRHNEEFHKAVAKSCGNRLLKNVMDQLNDALKKCEPFHAQNAERADVSMAGHVRLYQAIEEQDDDLARKIMTEHLSEIETLISEIICEE